MNKHQDIHVHPGEILSEDIIKPIGITIGEAVLVHLGKYKYVQK